MIVIWIGRCCQEKKLTKKMSIMQINVYSLKGNKRTCSSLARTENSIVCVFSQILLMKHKVISWTTHIVFFFCGGVKYNKLNMINIGAYCIYVESCVQECEGFAIIML